MELSIPELNLVAQNSSRLYQEAHNSVIALVLIKNRFLDAHAPGDYTKNEELAADIGVAIATLEVFKRKEESRRDELTREIERRVGRRN